MTQLTITKHQYQFNKTTSYKKKESPSKVSPVTIEIEKTLNEIQTVNFIKISNEKLIFINEVVKEIYLKPEEIQQEENKILNVGHISKRQNLIQKVGGLAMSVNIPTPLILFKQEMFDTYNQGLLGKFIASLTIGLTMTYGGYTLSDLLNGFFILLLIATGDAILGIIPGTVKGRSAQKDHTIQAKFIMFVVNVIGITVLLGVHLYLEKLIIDPSFAQLFVINIHYYGIGWVGVIYATRIFRYIATANKTKVPNFISSRLKNK